MTKYNSYIKVKCKCSPDCDKVPTFGCKGYFYAHLPEDVKAIVGTKRKLAQRNHNKRVALAKNLHTAQKEANPDTENLELWFRYQRYKMTGFCVCGCNLTSSKNDDTYFRFSAAHLLCKSKFKSIACHPDNCVELNFWQGHHTTFDNMGYEYCKTTKPILWQIVVEKFRILYPFIHNSEYKFIPSVLLETLINI